MNEKLYSKITDALVDDGYIILKDGLSQELIHNLAESAKIDSNYKSAGISSEQNLHIDTTKRRDKTRWIDEDSLCSSEYLAFCDGLRNFLNRSLYLGLSYYEAHFARYEKGDFYEKHLDAFQGSKNRVVTTVLYLNEEWQEESGGELVLYDENETEITKVIPNAGTMVIFLSDKFPHEVLPAKASRYSIAGWFRVDRRD